VVSEDATKPALSNPWASLKSCHEAALRRVGSSKDGIGAGEWVLVL